MVTQRALHDLTVHAVARHASLRSAAVAAHLQADQGLALAQLLLAELSPIALSFPAHTKTYKKNTQIYAEASRPSLVFLPVKPVAVAFVKTVVLCDGKAAQSHESPLHRRHVLPY